MSQPNTVLQRSVEIRLVRLSAPDALIERAEMLLSADERERALRFRFEEPRRKFILARCALRILLADHLGCAPDTVAFNYGDHGKPALLSTPVRFNLAHSGDFAAYAFASGCEVGIDLERIRPLPDLEDIARRFFAPAECADLLAVAQSEREAAFFRCWTRKEAYIKALGTGLSVPLADFQVSLLDSEPPALLSVAGDADEAACWALHDLSTPPGYAGAVAVRDRSRVVCAHPAATAAEILRG